MNPLNRSETSLPDEIIKLFNYWYNDQMNGHMNVLSGAYGLRCGVRQRGLSSPRIFNLYVNGLIEELSGAGGVECSFDRTFINMILVTPTTWSFDKRYREALWYM